MNSPMSLLLPPGSALHVHRRRAGWTFTFQTFPKTFKPKYWLASDLRDQQSAAVTQGVGPAQATSWYVCSGRVYTEKSSL